MPSSASRRADGRGSILQDGRRTASGRSTCPRRSCSASRRSCCATSPGSRAASPSSTSPASTSTTSRATCCATPPSRASASSSPSVTAPSEGSRIATRWSARGRCRWRTVAITLADFDGFAGEAMSSGERFAAGRRRCARVGTDGGRRGADQPARRADRARSGQAQLQLDGRVRRARPTTPRSTTRCGRSDWSCARQLGIGVPVGKDSLSMRTRWSEDGARTRGHLAGEPARLGVRAPATTCAARSPRSCAAATDAGARRPRRRGGPDGRLDPRPGHRPVRRPGARPRRPGRPSRPVCRGRRAARPRACCSAYHDRCDGGLWATVCEMAFAGRLGVRLDLASLVGDGDREAAARALLTEELGVVVEVPTARRDEACGILRERRARRASATSSARPAATPSIEVALDAKAVVHGVAARAAAGLGRGQLAHRGACATTPTAPTRSTRPPATRTTRGCSVQLAFDRADDVAAARSSLGRAPKVAVLREQGVNSHVETSYAIDLAGFDTYDVHMTDLQTGRARLRHVPGLRRVRRLQLRRHARRRRGLGALDPVQRGSSPTSSASSSPATDTFALGICNGCQMMAALARPDPGRRRPGRASPATAASSSRPG